jgi:hypothetical protein
MPLAGYWPWGRWNEISGRSLAGRMAHGVIDLATRVSARTRRREVSPSVGAMRDCGGGEYDAAEGCDGCSSFQRSWVVWARVRRSMLEGTVMHQL